PDREAEEQEADHDGFGDRFSCPEELLALLEFTFEPGAFLFGEAAFGENLVGVDVGVEGGLPAVARSAGDDVVHRLALGALDALAIEVIGGSQLRCTGTDDGNGHGLVSDLGLWCKLPACLGHVQAGSLHHIRIASPASRACRTSPAPPPGSCGC